MEEIRKIALEFFKDKFSSMYNKQKELIRKIEALEKICEGSFVKVEDHVKRILVVIDKHTQMIEVLDLEKKLKIDYMLKMNQLEKNDKTHQALYDKLFEEIKSLKEAMANGSDEITKKINQIIKQVNLIKK